MENQCCKKGCLKPIVIAMAIILMFVGVYYFYVSISTFTSLESLTEQKEIIFSSLQAIVFLLLCGALITFGILTFVKLSKGECPEKFLRLGLVTIPSAFAFISILSISFYINTITASSIFNLIIDILWCISILVLGILSFVNLNNNKKLFDIISSSLFIGFLIYTIFSLGSTTGTGFATIAIFAILSFGVLYLIKTLLINGQCCCEKVEEKETDTSEEK
jgi:hypothetical protein